MDGGNVASASGPVARLDQRRFLVFFVFPALLLLLAVVLPLIVGERTLFLRDVLNVHFEMKWVEARALAEGRLPLIDPFRFGGQPFLGNPNTAALYPSNLLLLVASPLWTLNAHFWLHLLLAPLSCYWLGRAWGLGRRAAWCAGVCYAGSGFFLSNLNLYNLMAAVTWLPALVAATLELARGRRPGLSFPALALLWMLLLLGGDPMSAAFGLLLAVSAPLVAGGLRGARWGGVAGAVALGTLLAAPQVVEFLRILPQSFRGYWRISEQAATAASFNPVTAIDWLLPMALGLPDLSFWGQRFYAGGAPLYYSLAPGALALALVLSSGWPRTTAARWAWLAIAAGIFIALGRHNPLVGWLLQTAGAGLLRLPVKLWPWVAVGGALLCGVGFERLARGGGRAVGRVLAALAVFYGALWLGLQGRCAAGSRWLRHLVPAELGDAFVDSERLRWSGLCLLSLLVLAALALLVRLGRRRPAALGVALAVHLGAQLLLLRPLMPTDDADIYRAPPPVAALLPAGAVLAHGDAGRLFGPLLTSSADFPDPRVLWLQRQTWEALYPYAAVRWGHPVEFASSPEGLDTFLGRATVQAIQGLPDAARVGLLEAAGVEYLLLGRRLEGVAAERAEEIAALPAGRRQVVVYRLHRTAPRLQVVGDLRWAEHLNAALASLTEPGFDPRRAVVLAGRGEPATGPGGRVEVVRESAERLVADVTAEGPAALVTQRAYLSLYGVRVDGVAVTPVVANLHRLAVPLAAGRHRVEIAINRRPLLLSTLVALLAAAVLALATRRLARKR